MTAPARPRSVCFRSLVLLAIPLLSVLTLSASAGATPASRVILHVDGGIAGIAMDGTRIVYEEVATRRSCQRTFVLNVVTGTRKRVRGCRPDYGSRALAIAGARVAWTHSDCGNSECNDDLATASLPRLKPRSLAHAHSEGDVDTGELEGTFIGSVVGSGKLLAVNRFTTVGGAITKSGLDVIGAKGLRRVASGPKTMFAEEADSGRIAVLRSDGSTGVYSAGGKLLLEVKPGLVSEQGDVIALRGDHLLVLTEARILEIYSVQSAALLHSWPVAESATSLDAFAGVAAYAASRGGAGPYKLHVLRLATGKDVVLDGGKVQLFPHSLELEAPGLVYAKDARTLAFVPLRRVLAAVS